VTRVLHLSQQSIGRNHFFSAWLVLWGQQIRRHPGQPLSPTLLHSEIPDPTSLRRTAPLPALTRPKKFPASCRADGIRNARTRAARSRRRSRRSGAPTGYRMRMQRAEPRSSPRSPRQQAGRRSKALAYRCRPKWFAGVAVARGCLSAERVQSRCRSSDHSLYRGTRTCRTLSNRSAGTAYEAPSLQRI
jgi:hypothetical protein